MFTQDLEDLLHSEIFFDGSPRQAQDILAEIETKLRSGGKKYVISKIFSDNTTLIGKTVALHADRHADYEVKEVIIEAKSFTSEYAIEVVYYNPEEVKNF